MVADFLAFLAVAAGACLLFSFNALRRFDFFDMSGFMDAGYRVMTGQALYSDFFYNAGPVHPYLHALFFKLFGFTKAAIIAHLCTGTILFCAATFALARRGRGRAEAAFLTALAALCFYGPVSHPWYDQNAALFLAAGLALFEAWRPWKSDLRALTAGLALGCLAGLSFMTKANVGLAAIGIFAATAAASGLGRRKRLRLARFGLGYALGLVSGVAILLFTLKAPEEFFYDDFLAYHVTARLEKWDRLGQTLLTTPFLYLLAAAASAGGGRRFILRHRVTIATLAGLLMGSIFSTWTGSMQLRANMPLAGLAFIYLARLLDGSSLRYARTTKRIAVAALAAFAIQTTANLQAWTWQPSDERADYSLTTKGFEGWRCNRAIGEGVDRVVAYLNESVPRQESVFVFPDATLIYGMTGRHSYLHAPFIFTYGVAPAPGAPKREFVENFLAQPPRWVVLHYQTESPLYDTNLFLQALYLDEVFASDYRTAWRWGDFKVLRLVRRPPLPRPRSAPPA